MISNTANEGHVPPEPPYTGLARDGDGDGDQPESGDSSPSMLGHHPRGDARGLTFLRNEQPRRRAGDDSGATEEGRDDEDAMRTRMGLMPKCSGDAAAGDTGNRSGRAGGAPDGEQGPIAIPWSSSSGHKAALTIGDTLRTSGSCPMVGGS